MKESKPTAEQIEFALRQAKVGIPVVDLCRKRGVTVKVKVK